MHQSFDNTRDVDDKSLKASKTLFSDAYTSFLCIGCVYASCVITLNCTIPAYLASGLLMPLPSQSHAE
jgi:hypothetical protein